MALKSPPLSCKIRIGLFNELSGLKAGDGDDLARCLLTWPLIALLSADNKLFPAQHSVWIK
ncbi:hypothetical protein COLO4_00220 [Corchorus olitorius]|uniref:Uncharacterized protein n=1 Tax=Corchorus olitorius TaxID=93759 RepID=A0A1R3L4A8_9ROSI|nr:hypothetical protein COLO4_00220 [Corchorus olitorius]